MTNARRASTVRAPRGAEIPCKGWHQEAALRMLMNNLDLELFVETGRAYRRALADTGRASRKCALRYSVYLMDWNLPGLLGRASRQPSFSSTCRCA
jgi:hypothetical protein